MYSFKNFEKKVVSLVCNAIADKMDEIAIISPDGSISEVSSWILGYHACQKDVMKIMLSLCEKGLDEEDEGPRDSLCQQ